MPARLFRLEHAAPDHRADHAHGRCRDHRPFRAIQLGRHPAAGVHHRCAGAAARFEPLSRHHVQRRRARRQRRVLGEGVLEHVGWTERSIAGSTIPTAPSITRWCGCSSSPSGFRLLVGRDLEERERLYDIILAAGQWSIAVVIVLGLAGSFFVARRVLRRVDAMTETARTIMAGDLSGRLPTAAGRRARPPRGQPQHDAGAHRSADARLQGSLRQYRPRSEDAVDAASQPRRGGAAHGQATISTIAPP